VGMNKPFLPSLPTSPTLPTLPTLPTFQISLKHRTQKKGVDHDSQKVSCPQSIVCMNTVKKSRLFPAFLCFEYRLGIKKDKLFSLPRPFKQNPAKPNQSSPAWDVEEWEYPAGVLQGEGVEDTGRCYIRHLEKKGEL
jgi:hypothetical protein